MQRTYHSNSFEKVRYRYFATNKEGSEVVVVIIFNLYRIYLNEAWNISVIVKRMKKIAKRVNQTEIIYKSDIDDMKKSIEKFSNEQGAIHSLLLKRKK